MLHAPQYGRRRPGKPRQSKIAALMLAITWLTSGCTYATLELRHTSHPLAGPPFGPRSEEDSLNTANACAGIERGAWFFEQCLGYKYTDGGFYGPPLTYDARVGRRFNFKQR